MVCIYAGLRVYYLGHAALSVSVANWAGYSSSSESVKFKFDQKQKIMTRKLGNFWKRQSNHQCTTGTKVTCHTLCVCTTLQASDIGLLCARVCIHTSDACWIGPSPLIGPPNEHRILPPSRVTVWHAAVPEKKSISHNDSRMSQLDDSSTQSPVGFQWSSKLPTVIQEHWGNSVGT